MIYRRPEADSPVATGDVFVDLPSLDVSLSRIVEVQPSGVFETTWEEMARREGAPLTVAVQARKVRAIVVTPLCDALRAHFITLCEIIPFLGVAEGKPGNPAKWMKKIIDAERQQPRYFYLPAAPEIGFDDRQKVDFAVTHRVARIELESWRARRVASLVEAATAHLREKLANFIRRYAFNEWYPLTREEFDAYRKGHPDAAIEPLPWQAQAASDPLDINQASPTSPVEQVPDQDPTPNSGSHGSGAPPGESRA